MNLPGWSIPIGRAALCGSCLVLFDMSGNVCPKCGAEAGWSAIESDRAAKLIGQLRDLLDVAEATLKIISLRRLGPTSALAGRVADKLREFRTNDKAPESPSASSRKEAVQ